MQIDRNSVLTQMVRQKIHTATYRNWSSTDHPLSTRCSQKRLRFYHNTSNTEMEVGITTLTPTLDPSQACMSSHTSKPTPSFTKNQQSHQNYELNLEHKLVPSIHYAYTIKTCPLDQRNIPNKWMTTPTLYKSPQCSTKPHTTYTNSYPGISQ